MSYHLVCPLYKKDNKTSSHPYILRVLISADSLELGVDLFGIQQSFFTRPSFTFSFVVVSRLCGPTGNESRFLSHRPLIDTGRRSSFRQEPNNT